MGTSDWHPATRAREAWPLPHLRRAGAVAWHPAHTLPLLRFLLPLVRRAGYMVNVWTVDDPGRMRQLARWGATGIITNDPAGATAALSDLPLH
jgi:glycerophosphoryl diester phosphodiesterase